MSKSLAFPMYYNVPLICRLGIPVMWGICGGLGSFALFIATLKGVVSSNLQVYFFGVTTAVIITSAVASFFVPKVIRRIRIVYSLIGLMTCITPTAIGVLSVMYFIAKPNYLHSFMLLISVICMWLIQVYIEATRRVKNKKLIERNYTEQDDCFVLQRPINEFNGDLKLNAKQHAKKNWIYIFIGAWSLYEFITTDFKALLPLDLFMYWIFSSIGLTLLAYSCSRLVQGFYLWFYIIWKLERKTRKKFLFPDPELHQINGFN